MPYREGREAYERGLLMIDNPYNPHFRAASFKAWNEGFTDAKGESK